MSWGHCRRPTCTCVPTQPIDEGAVPWILSETCLRLKTTSSLSNITICTYICQRSIIYQVLSKRKISSHDSCLWGRDFLKVKKRSQKHRHIGSFHRTSCLPFLSYALKMTAYKADPPYVPTSMNKEVIAVF
jgi:hypothetical protein